MQEGESFFENDHFLYFLLKKGQDFMMKRILACAMALAVTAMGVDMKGMDAPTKHEIPPDRKSTRLNSSHII